MDQTPLRQSLNDAGLSRADQDLALSLIGAIDDNRDFLKAAAGLLDERKKLSDLKAFMSGIVAPAAKADTPPAARRTYVRKVKAEAPQPRKSKRETDAEIKANISESESTLDL